MRASDAQPRETEQFRSHMGRASGAFGQVPASRRRNATPRSPRESPPPSDWADRPATGRPATGHSMLPAGRTNTPASELYPERITVDLEDPSGFGEIPPDAFENAQHDLTLELICRLVEGESLGRPDLGGLLGQRDIQREIVELDDRPLGQHHAPLDDVLEL